MIGVALGAEGDLKRLMQESKMANMIEDETIPGAPNDAMYLKQARHYLRTASYTAAVQYTMKSIEMNPESTVIASLVGP